MRLSAPAKINLHLRVGPTGRDGFHPLFSWMATVGLFDTLNLELTNRPGVQLTCDDPAIACDQTNLVARVATGLLTHLGEEGTPVGVAAALQKRIPVGAGLGGGSSDGAATIIGLCTLLNLPWDAKTQGDFAARFGSDLSFFCHGPSSLCTGRGEVVRPIAIPAPRWAVLILPGLHMATPAVYRRFDEMGLGDSADLEAPADLDRWPALPALELLPRLVNDLEIPAFSLSRDLAGLHERASRVLGRIVRMSGSGSTLFTLFDEESQALRGAKAAQETLGTRAVAVRMCPHGGE